MSRMKLNCTKSGPCVAAFRAHSSAQARGHLRRRQRRQRLACLRGPASPAADSAVRNSNAVLGASSEFSEQSDAVLQSEFESSGCFIPRRADGQSKESSSFSESISTALAAVEEPGGSVRQVGSNKSPVTAVSKTEAEEVEAAASQFHAQTGSPASEEDKTLLTASPSHRDRAIDAGVNETLGAVELEAASPLHEQTVELVEVDNAKVGYNSARTFMPATGYAEKCTNSGSKFASCPSGCSDKVTLIPKLRRDRMHPDVVGKAVATRSNEPVVLQLNRDPTKIIEEQKLPNRWGVDKTAAPARSAQKLAARSRVAKFSSGDKNAAKVQSKVNLLLKRTIKDVQTVPEAEAVKASQSKTLRPSNARLAKRSQFKAARKLLPSSIETVEAAQPHMAAVSIPSVCRNMTEEAAAAETLVSVQEYWEPPDGAALGTDEADLKSNPSSSTLSFLLTKRYLVTGMAKYQQLQKLRCSKNFGAEPSESKSYQVFLSLTSPEVAHMFNYHAPTIGKIANLTGCKVRLMRAILHRRTNGSGTWARFAQIEIKGTRPCSAMVCDRILREKFPCYSDRRIRRLDCSRLSVSTAWQSVSMATAGAPAEPLAFARQRFDQWNRSTKPAEVNY